VTVRAKLALAQAPLVAVVLVVGAASLRTTRALGEASQRVLSENYRSVLAAQRMKESIERLDSAALFVIAGRWERALDQARQHRARFEEELRVAEGNVTEPDEPRALADLRARWREYRSEWDAFALLDPAAARDAYFARLEPAFVAVKAAAERILEINQDAMLRKSEAARRTADRFLDLMLGATVAALLLGVAATFALTSRLLRPLGELSTAVRRFGTGDVEARAPATSHDEIAGVAREFNEMADRLAEYRRSSLGELLQAQQSAQAAIDSLPDAVFVLDAGGAILNVNSAAEALAGGAAGSVSDLRPELRGPVERAAGHVVGGKGAFVPRGLEESARVDGTEGPRWLLPRAAPLYSEAGSVAGATVVLQDVTRLRRFDELRSDVVATVAHELRTPLTSLRMAVHLCAEEAAGPISEKQADLLFAAREDCERLQRIVDDLLDLSRVEAGRMELQRGPVSPATLLAEAVSQAHAVADAGKVQLDVQPSPPDAPVLADAARIQLVLANLVSNAIRHTPAGGRVAVAARQGRDAVTFEVRDTGEGIPAEHLDRVFERFYRVPGARSGATGLGLYLSREIVRAHGGEMGVDSVPGQGSRFWFTLPLVADAAVA
jgi:signal transduction histidine kinase